MRRRVGQPEEIVGDPGANAPSRRRVPPVLHISFNELPGRRAEDLLPGELGGGVDEGHDILKLVAKSVGAARLVKRGPGPEPATDHLVQQPSIQEQIEGGIGCVNLDGLEDAIPLSARLLECNLGLARFPEPSNQLVRRCEVIGLAEEEDDLGGFLWIQLEAGLDGRTGIDSRAGASGESDALERGRAGRRAMPAQELHAVGGDRLGRRLTSAKATRWPKSSRNGVSGQKSARVGVELGHDVHRRAIPRRPQNPLGEERRRQSPRPRARCSADATGSA